MTADNSKKNFTTKKKKKEIADFVPIIYLFSIGIIETGNTARLSVVLSH